MMRLLDKRSVSVQVAVEKKRQIDAGVVLASKVDALRETKLKEEAQLAIFRSESIARTQEEINQKILERDSLVGQIKKRKDELEELRKPLDEEWQEVNSKIRTVNHLSQTLNTMRNELEQGIALNIRRERENDEEKQRIATERERTVTALTEAELKRELASDTLVKAKTKSDSLIRAAEEIDIEVSEREQAVTWREKEISRETTRLKKIEKQQKEKDKEIKDKYETLQRDIERIHGKRRNRPK